MNVEKRIGVGGFYPRSLQKTWGDYIHLYKKDQGGFFPGGGGGGGGGGGDFVRIPINAFLKSMLKPRCQGFYLGTPHLKDCNTQKPPDKFP